MGSYVKKTFKLPSKIIRFIVAILDYDEGNPAVRRFVISD
jgi:hypothetical protein